MTLLLIYPFLPALKVVAAMRAAEEFECNDCNKLLEPEVIFMRSVMAQSRQPHVSVLGTLPSSWVLLHLTLSL